MLLHVRHACQTSLNVSLAARKYSAFRTFLQTRVKAKRVARWPCSICRASTLPAALRPAFRRRIRKKNSTPQHADRCVLFFIPRDGFFREVNKIPRCKCVFVPKFRTKAASSTIRRDKASDRPASSDVGIAFI